MAAALAYTTVLSLVPVCALAVLYTKIAGKLDQYSVNIQEWILRSLVAESAQGIINYINQFIDNLHTKALGTIGIGGLLFTAYSLLNRVEKTLNSIWMIKRHRSIWSRFQILCSMLVVVPTFLSLSFYISGKFQMSSTLGSFSVLVPLILTLGSLFFIFKFVPNTLVQWRSAFMAALLSALLFEAAKIGFNYYVSNLVNMDKIYGSLGLIPVLLIWIYISWLIVLFGVELAFAFQNSNYVQRAFEKSSSEATYFDVLHEDRGLLIIQAMARLFSEGGGPVTIEALENQTKMNAETLMNHLDILVKKGLLTEIQSENYHGPAYLFSRPIDQIKISEIINSFRSKLKLDLIPENDQSILQTQQID
ncbi:MAG: YihY family inner membrane protein [Bdellovibrionales bacterium]|nr:YihY family inner membrane protein [Bdellovibrionales bacterium]